jgi:hypothetical protein
MSYRYNFRRRAIPWALVEGFRVGPASGLGSWSCVMVNLRLRGGVRLLIAGTRRSVSQVVAQYEAAYRAEPEAQPVNAT